MTGLALTIRHGVLNDIEGPPRRFGDVSFVPANVALKGNSFDPASELADFIAEYPSETRAIVKPGDDAAWVLGRLMCLFGTKPTLEEERPEKTCFFTGFVAVMPGDELIGIPFECSDYYGRSSIKYSNDDPPPDEVQAYVASAFWKLLLENPRELVEYSDKMFHDGAGVWIRFGVENGEPFMREEPDTEDD